MSTSIQSLNSTQSAILVNGVQSIVLDSTGIVSGIGKNKLINSLGLINQRGVSGTVTLAAGAYGHDRFKAGASGCTYTFSTALNFTIFTILAGTLVQIIEGLNLQSGPVVLGWTGTSQGRIDAGAYGASGITGTAIGGNNMAVEFGGGTVSLAQLETGSKSSYFEQRHYGLELSLCQRYFVKAPIQGIAYNATSLVPTRGFPVPMRELPTVIWSGILRASTNGGAFTPASFNTAAFDIYGVGYFAASSFDFPLTAGVPYDGLLGATYAATAEL